MELALHNTKTAMTLSDQVFKVDFNEGLVHQVVCTYLTNGRAGTRAQKNRSAVSGGGIKPWRQKGTGRARAGTIRSPLWRSGGVTFAAEPKKYDKKINKKMYKAALRSILSELIRQERLLVIDSLKVETPKTKEFLTWLKKEKLDQQQRLLLVFDGENSNAILASRNLPLVKTINITQIEPVSLVSAEKTIITKAALKQLEEGLV